MLFNSFRYLPNLYYLFLVVEMCNFAYGSDSKLIKGDSNLIKVD